MIGSTSDVELMKEIISRMYGCIIIQFQQNNVTLIKPGVLTRTHCNLLPAILAMETESAFVIFYEHTAKYSLRELVFNCLLLFYIISRRFSQIYPDL